MTGANQRMRFFALRAPTSKAFGGMPLHHFTLNIIQISERERARVHARGRMGMREM